MNTALSECREGDTVVITRLSGSGAFKKRLLDLGFRKGQKLSIIRYAPLKDPMEVRIGDSNVSLRVEEAEQVAVSCTEEHGDES
ncbi:MAG TPA: ferrous iron transport protein A [Sediminispirochaeta sp.]|nr:ferrous iron transport protein A [Sediminispirochaeta sp.]